VELVLEDNNFSGVIPEDIFFMGTIGILSLAGNNLTSAIPSNIGNMTSIVLLDLAGNSLSGEIPASISSLRSLQLLDLSRNQLSGMIPSIGGLTELRKCCLQVQLLFCPSSAQYRCLTFMSPLLQAN